VTPAEFISKVAFFHRKMLGNTEGLLLYELVYQDAQSRKAWRFLEETTTLTVTDETPIDLPANFRKVWEVRVDGDVYSRCEYLDRDKYGTGCNPRTFYILGSQIGFPGYSNASGSSNVALTYIQAVANPTAVATASIFPDYFDPFFTQMGVGLLWQREGNFGKASNHMQQAESMMEGLVAQDNKPVKGEARRIPHVEEFYPRRY
jgi:hypothetical protein